MINQSDSYLCQLKSNKGAAFKLALEDGCQRGHIHMMMFKLSDINIATKYFSSALMHNLMFSTHCGNHFKVFKE